MKINNITAIENGKGLMPLWLRIKLTLGYFMKTRKLALFAFLLFALAVILYAFIGEIKTRDWNTLGGLFNIGTLLVVLAVWWSELKENWRNSLPKYISAVFIFEGDECEELSYKDYALVFHESDIRPLSQQLGMQKNNRAPLKFDPTKYRIDSELKYGSCENRCQFAFQHFTVSATLTELPKKKLKNNNKFRRNMTKIG